MQLGEPLVMLEDASFVLFDLLLVIPDRFGMHGDHLFTEIFATKPAVWMN